MTLKARSLHRHLTPINSRSITTPLICATLLLAIVGNFQIWFGESALTLPLGLLPIILVLLLQPRLQLLKQHAILLALVELSGMCGVALNMGSWSRAIAASIWIPIGILTFAVARSTQISRLFHRVLDFGSVMLSILVIYAFASAFIETPLIYSIKTSINTPLGNSNYLAGFLAFFLVRNSFRGKVLTLIAFVGLICTLSRTSIGIGTGVLICRYILLNGAAWKRLTIVIAIGVVGLFSYNYILALADSISGLQANDSLLTRLELWSTAAQQITNSPLFGFGPGGSRAILQSEITDQNTWDPHNAILSLALNFGIIGLLAYLLHLVLTFRLLKFATKVDANWLGTRWGLLTMLTIALLEPIVTSIGFEFFVALLAGQALALRQVSVITDPK